MPKAISNTMSKAAGRASPHTGRPGRDPASILKSENGDVNYFSTVVFIFIAVILLVLNCTLFFPEKARSPQIKISSCKLKRTANSIFL